MTMQSRQNSYAPGGEQYRYAYNGMEQDEEVSDAGNSYTTEFRQYDPRLGRWKSLDPLMAKFPWQSPYCAFDDNPVFYVDPYGLASEGGGDDEPPTNVTVPNGKRNRPSYLRPDGKAWIKGDVYHGNDGSIWTYMGKDADSELKGAKLSEWSVVYELTLELEEVTVKAPEQAPAEIPYVAIIPEPKGKPYPVKIPKGTKLKIVMRTGAEAGIGPLGGGVGTLEISVPNNTELGTWNRKVITGEGFSASAGGGAGFFIRTEYEIELNKSMSGNSFIHALERNISQIRELRGGILYNQGYIEVFDQNNKVIYSAHGNGTGMNISAGISEPVGTGLNLENYPMTTWDSVRGARGDEKLYNNGGQELLQRLGLEK